MSLMAKAKRKVKELIGVGEPSAQLTESVKVSTETVETPQDSTENSQYFTKPTMEVVREERPKAKIWVNQEPKTIDIHPTLSSLIIEMDEEKKRLAEDYARCEFARRKAIENVLKHFEVMGKVGETKFEKTEFGTYQLVVPQPDVLKID